MQLGRSLEIDVAGQLAGNEFAAVGRPLETSFSRRHLSCILGWSRGVKWVQNAYAALETSLYRIIQVAFWAGQVSENKFAVPGDHFNHRFLDLTQVAFWAGQEAENELKVQCEPLKHRFLDITQVAFWAAQEAGNEFTVPGDHLKLRFLDLTQVAFWVKQEA